MTNNLTFGDEHRTPDGTVIGTLSLTDKLKAIIEAQNKGGYNGYCLLEEGEWQSIDWSMDCGDIFAYDHNGDQFRITTMEILLDTEGCKAAYGEHETRGNTGMTHFEWYVTYVLPAYREAGQMILESWHSGDYGNNWKAAIDTAYSLLP